MKQFIILGISIISLLTYCSNKTIKNNINNYTDMQNLNTEIAILANGCFWCTEAIFQGLKGVVKVEPGYIGGEKENPTYQEVCTGTTNHAEALRIYFNASEISYAELLEVYFETHDPTSLNRQGEDVGTQYRSEIFYTSDNQKDIASNYLEQLTREKVFDKPIVTKISKATTFWVAENYHHDYYSSHKEQPYCNAVIGPKVQKFKAKYAEKLK